LVESRILYRKLTQWLDMHLENQKRIIIRTRPQLLSKLVGQKRTNIEAVKEKYRLNEVIVKGDLEDGEFLIEVE